MRYMPNERGYLLGSSTFSPTCHDPCKKEPLIFKIVENNPHEGISSCLFCVKRGFRGSREVVDHVLALKWPKSMPIRLKL